jgi:tetratricopeptide (TPR) repeat protein/TolB-like protein
MIPVFTRIIAVSIVCLATLSWLAMPLSARSNPASVLVFAFENQTDDRNIDWIGTGLSELVVERLTAERELYVFNRDERTTAYGRMGIPESVAVTRATAMSIGWDTGADFVVIGRIYGTHQDFRLEARILNLQDSSSGLNVTVDGDLQNLIPMASRLSFKLARQLVPESTTPESDYIAHPPVPSSAFEDYIRGTIATDSARRITLFQDALRLHPQYTAAVYQLGRQYSLNLDFRNSTPMLEKVPNGSPEFLQARFILGLNYYNAGEFEKSIAILSALPPVYDVLINLGMAYAGNNDFPGAMAAWKRASELNPFGTEAPFNMAHLGGTRSERSDLEAAARSIEQFLKLNSRDAEAIFLQGRIYERLGRVDESQKLIATAVNLSPRIARWVNQPLTNFRRLRPQPSVTDLRLAPQLTIWNEERLQRRAHGRDVASWLDVVQKSIDSQFYGEALRELQDIARTFPQSAETHLMFAEVYEEQKQNDLAVAEYQRAIALKPAADTWILLARLYRTMNQPASERLALDSALALEPGNTAAAARKAELDRPRNPNRRRQP